MQHQATLVDRVSHEHVAVRASEASALAQLALAPKAKQSATTKALTPFAFVPAPRVPIDDERINSIHFLDHGHKNLHLATTISLAGHLATDEEGPNEIVLDFALCHVDPRSPKAPPVELADMMQGMSNEHRKYKNYKSILSINGYTPPAKVPTVVLRREDGYRVAVAFRIHATSVSQRGRLHPPHFCVRVSAPALDVAPVHSESVETRTKIRIGNSRENSVTTLKQTLALLRREHRVHGYDPLAPAFNALPAAGSGSGSGSGPAPSASAPAPARSPVPRRQPQAEPQEDQEPPPWSRRQQLAADAAKDREIEALRAQMRVLQAQHAAVRKLAAERLVRPGSPRGDKRLKLSDEEKAAVLRLHKEDFHCDFHFDALFSSQGFFGSCGDMAAFDDSIPPTTTAAEPGQKRKRGQ